MVLRTAHGARTGEDVEDLRVWLLELPTPGPLSETVVLACRGHGGDSGPTWMYVEADPVAGVARRRCLACAQSAYLLDSEPRWTHPQTWACQGCAHSIVEVVAGLHLVDGAHVDWVALAARCVDCGRVAGLTDITLEPTPRADVLARL